MSDQICCPEDQVACQFYDKEKGINSFPINFAIRNLIKEPEKIVPVEPAPKYELEKK